jgi:hypothetical protein
MLESAVALICSIGAARSRFMSRACRRLQTPNRNTAMKAAVRLPYALALLVLGTACSRDEPAAPRPPITPAIEPAQNPHLTDKARVLSAELNAGGAATSYEAYFTNGQLTRITEQRARPAGGPARGEYEFLGARLLRYTGAPSEGDGALALELDMQGRVVAARVDGRAASQEQIGQISSRAQLLRSHALAQSAAREHVAH